MENGQPKKYQDNKNFINRKEERYCKVKANGAGVTLSIGT
jgi:hypothetical protein